MSIVNQCQFKTKFRPCGCCRNSFRISSIEMQRGCWNFFFNLHEHGRVILSFYDYWILLSYLISYLSYHTISSKYNISNIRVLSPQEHLMLSMKFTYKCILVHLFKIILLSCCSGIETEITKKYCNTLDTSNLIFVLIDRFSFFFFRQHHKKNPST